MTTAIDSQRNNSSQGIQLTQADKLILMMNNEKAHLPQFASVSNQIQMKGRKEICTGRKIFHQEIELRQEHKSIAMTNAHKMSLHQFEPVSILIRM
jgi:hypothetical protein